MKSFVKMLLHSCLGPVKTSNGYAVEQDANIVTEKGTREREKKITSERNHNDCKCEIWPAASG